MKTIALDKIGSVTRNCRLDREVRLSDRIPAVEGGVIAARVLSEKSGYNQIELPSGRFSQVKQGDVIAGALGHRKALFGYAGRVPAAVAPGDRIEVLNLGGVLGICESVNPDLGPPFQCEVLGQVLAFPVLGERIGIPAHIEQGALPLVDAARPLDLGGVPVIAVVGTCMNAGKTAAACALVHELDGRGMTVAAAKATGVSLYRDVHAMEDAGARRTLAFTDLGIVTTTAAVAPRAARTLLSRLAEERPDAIVLELGDGLLGLYGVDAILDDRDLARSFGAVVLAANDPVAAWGGVTLLRERHGMLATVVTGPATDNAAGVKLVAAHTGAAGINARTSPAALADHVLAALGSRVEEGALA